MSLQACYRDNLPAWLDSMYVFILAVRNPNGERSSYYCHGKCANFRRLRDARQLNRRMIRILAQFPFSLEIVQTIYKSISKSLQVAFRWFGRAQQG